MHLTKSFCLRALLGVGAALLCGLSNTIFASPVAAATEQSSEDTHQWLLGELRYLEIEDKVTTEDLNALTAQWHTIRSGETSLEQKQAAYLELFHILFRLQGRDPDPVETFLSRLAASWARAANTPPPPNSETWPSDTSPLGALGKVVRKGHGPVPMILIPPIGFDEIVFDAFMERNSDLYTMYAVTPAGFGDTPPPPRPEQMDPGTPLWWDSFEQGVLRLMEEENLEPAVVVGMVAGVYPAARLALDHPEKFRAAILLNGLLNSPMASPADPSRPATREERIHLAPTRFNLGIPSSFMVNRIRPATERMRENARNLSPQMQAFNILINTRDSDRGLDLYVYQNRTSNPVARSRYTLELMATDLTEGFKALQVPTLVIPSMSDDLFPTSPSRANIVQWTELLLEDSSLPLTVVPFYDTRMFATEDSPEELDRAIADFLAGRPVRPKQKEIYANRVSPAAGLVQRIGNMEITVRYSRPQVKGRTIWGDLVPYGEVWRTGANETTTISFSTDVFVQGRPLAAGQYALFTIPGEQEWTVVFNRVLPQWGAFTYKEKFDVLRVTVQPEPAAHEEWLTFRVDPLSDSSGTITLRWERLAFPIHVEIASSEK